MEGLVREIHNTSREVYEKIVNENLLGGFQLETYHIIVHNAPMTAGEAAEIYVEANPGTKRARTEVAKRFSELKRMGTIEIIGERACRVTGHNSKLWDVTGRMPLPLTANPTLKEKCQMLRTRLREYVLRFGPIAKVDEELINDL